MNNPEYFFKKSEEHANITLSNEYILSNHLLCVATEFPLQEDEQLLKMDEVESILNSLIEKKRVCVSICR